MLRATGHARMVSIARRAQHLRCSLLCERSKRGDNKLDKHISVHFYQWGSNSIKKAHLFKSYLVGLQPTVIASRASPPLLEPVKSYHARMARRARHLRCSLRIREANERTTSWIISKVSFSISNIGLKISDVIENMNS